MHILYPRNFGNSDKNPDMSTEAVADDIVRYMWNNQISTALLGGHGFGASFALKSAINHMDKTTGFFGVDYTPVNYNYYQVARDFKALVGRLRLINLAGANKGNIFAQINLVTEVSSDLFWV